jgi:predicted dehydrogenase
MSGREVSVGVIGTGFGQRVQIPGFEACDHVRVLAICSRRQERAEACARKFDIPYVFTDYRQMVQMEELDLVSVATPPYLHHAMVFAALECGKHVICEKPLAMNVAEAREMYAKAQEAGVIHLVDYELRFDPSRGRLKELLDDGFIGSLRHVTLTSVSNSQMDESSRPWGWWSQQDKGGGLLGANGSHQIDQLRWWFGGIAGVYGRDHTFVEERLQPGSLKRRRVTSEDFVSLVVEFLSGALGVLSLTSVATHSLGGRIELYGDEGSLILDEEGRLWGAGKGQGWGELSMPGTAPSLEGAAGDMWRTSFVHLAQYVVDVIRRQEPVSRGATFYDGFRCQEVMQAVSKSFAEGRWVEVRSDHKE